MTDARAPAALAAEARLEASEGDQPNEALLTRIADLLDRLAAPEGVGLTRYAVRPTTFHGSPAYEVLHSPNGEWVRHDDAAAALAAKDVGIAEMLREWQEQINAKDARAERVEAQVATLKEALETAETALFWSARQHRDDGNKRAQQATELSAHTVRAALSTLPAPAARGEG